MALPNYQMKNGEMVRIKEPELPEQQRYEDRANLQPPVREMGEVVERDPVLVEILDAIRDRLPGRSG